MKQTVVIVGAGISGLMAAYRLSEGDNAERFNIIILEKGKSLDKRSCPIIMKKADACVHCKESCAIMQGIAGAGAFSDGKYNMTTEYGGWLKEFISADAVMDYIHQADDILCENGADVKTYKPDDKLKKYFTDRNIEMLQGEVKHLGTDLNFVTMQNMVKTLVDRGVRIFDEFEVTGVDEYTEDGHNYKVHTQTKIGYCAFYAHKVILALGRIGNKLLLNWCQDKGIGIHDSYLDIGVRVETPAYIWNDIAEKVYEPKLHIRSRHGQDVRTFCFNHRGEVVMENSNGILSVNGHAYEQKEKKTDVSNFAVLVSYPVKNPLLYGRSIAKLANSLTDGKVLYQRYPDFYNMTATQKDKHNGSLQGAVAGNLWDCLPAKVANGIVDMMEKLNTAVPGVTGMDTLLYGIEVKYYSVRPNFKNNDFEIEDNLYAIGDGAGVTRSLSQAAANGLYVADKILEKE